jgi:cell division protein FtsB
MGGVKQGKSVHKNAPVKQTNIKRVAIAILLALVGLGIYTVAYQYTHQAKLEADVRAKQSQIQKQLKELENKTNLNAEQQKQIEELNKQLQAKADAKAARVAYNATIAKQTAVAGSMTFTGDKATWMSQAGIAPSDWGYVDYIISHESGWRPDARNSIGCLGLAQACPGQKILNVCPTLDPVCQLQWASGYAGRYGGWAGAYNAWISKHWW